MNANEPNKPNEQDIALFRAAVGEVQPLKVDRAELAPPKPSPRPIQSERDEQQVIQDLLSEAYDPEHLQPGDMISYAIPGITRSVFRKLKRGQYRLEGELDLHGLTSSEARQALVRFLGECRQRGRRSVRIIHGKGNRSTNEGPVLKSRVNTWLRQRQEVLAFCSARPQDGGTGAVYVLLRA